jgi:hypothetical protein
LTFSGSEYVERYREQTAFQNVPRREALRPEWRGKRSGIRVSELASGYICMEKKRREESTEIGWKNGRGGCAPRLAAAEGATEIDRIARAIEKGSGIDAGSGPSAVR